MAPIRSASDICTYASGVNPVIVLAINTTRMPASLARSSAVTSRCASCSASRSSSEIFPSCDSMSSAFQSICSVT